MGMNIKKCLCRIVILANRILRTSVLSEKSVQQFVKMRQKIACFRALKYSLFRLSWLAHLACHECSLSHVLNEDMFNKLSCQPQEHQSHNIVHLSIHDRTKLRFLKTDASKIVCPTCCWKNMDVYI